MSHEKREPMLMEEAEKVDSEPLQAISLSEKLSFLKLFGVYLQNVCLFKKPGITWEWWCTPVIPASGEGDTEELKV
jgi:hypothetical protein